MLNFEILEDGNLSVTAINPDEIKEMIDDNMGYYQIIAELFEETACNGSYTFFEGSEGNPFTGLNDFPSIAESMDVLDDGTKVIEGNFWYFADYVTKLETDELAKGNTVIYTLYKD